MIQGLLFITCASCGVANLQAAIPLNAEFCASTDDRSQVCFLDFAIRQSTNEVNTDIQSLASRTTTYPA